MILKTIRKYLLVATGVSLTANVALFFALRHSEAQQEIVVEQARVEALTFANERAARAAAAAASAAKDREDQLRARIDRMEQTAVESLDRARRAEAALSDFVTEQQSDVSEEFVEWKDQPVPSSVVARLRSLQDVE